VTGKSRAEILMRGKYSLERSILMEILYELCKISQIDIGRRMGAIDYSAVSQSRKRLRQKLSQDLKLQKRFIELKAELSDLSSLKI
jgi:chromosomal replication initiation ATPase DnaA